MSGKDYVWTFAAGFICSVTVSLDANINKLSQKGPLSWLKYSTLSEEGDKTFHPDMSENFSLHETRPEVQVEWRIDRFLSLIEKPMYEQLNSSAFSLSDAQWFLHMDFDKDTDDDSGGWIDLWLYKRYSTPKKHAVKFTLGVRRRDGSVYESFDEEYEFQEYDCEGMVHFIHFSELRQSENVLTTDGSLRVFAIVRLAEPTVLDEVVDTPRELPFRAMHTEEVSSEWKVEDFTSLPKDKEFSLKSPTFPMAGSTWCMEVFPNGNDCDDPGWVYLYLHREGSASETQRVAYTLGFRKTDGTPHRLYHDEDEFDTDDGYGCDCFIRSSELLDPRNGLVSEGSVTFFCTARVHYSSLSVTAAEAEGGAPTSSDPSHEEGASRTTPSEQGETTGSSVKSLLKQLKHLVVSGHHGDVTFNVKDQVFPAHRPILAVRSPVFSAMFDNDTEEKRTGIVTVTDFQPDIIKDLLSFIYTGDEGVVSSRNAAELYKAADKYDIQDLKDAALRCMTQEMSPGNFFDVVVLASLYDESRLLKMASDFFVENVKLISPTPEWLTFMREHLTLANELLQLLINRKL